MILERVDIKNSDDLLQIVLHRNRYNFVLERLSPGQSILEIGVGEGVLTKELLSRCVSYVGVDYDSDVCLNVKRKVGQSVEIMQADARKLPFKANEFSFIVCLEVIEHLGDWKEGVNNIHRCVRPDRIAIISVPYRRFGGKSRINPYHLYEPGEGELVSLLKRLFTNAEVFYQYFEETQWMTLARKLHVRRFFGLDKIYADLSAGAPSATSKIHIGRKRKGMIEGLIVVVSGKKHQSPSQQSEGR